MPNSSADVPSTSVASPNSTIGGNTQVILDGDVIGNPNTSSSAFVSFPCTGCSNLLQIITHLTPGQAAVIECDNCGMSWTVYNPSLIVVQTKELPEDLQSVWRKLSE